MLGAPFLGRRPLILITMQKLVYTTLVVALPLFFLIGCSSEPAKTTPQQEKDFKGGPMPESARIEFEKSQKEVAARIAAARAAAVNGKQTSN